MMIIKKLNLRNKKAQGVGINKTVGIILVILVIATGFVFLFRVNLAKWLKFLPDYDSEVEEGFQVCEVDDSCGVLSSECVCENRAGANQPCFKGEFCYSKDEGCVTTGEPDWYKDTSECKK